MTFPAFLYDLGSFLQTAGVGTLGTDIHYRGFDSETVNDIAIIPTAGRGNSNAVSPDDVLYFAAVRILIRNLDGDTADSKATAIYNLMNLVTNRIIGTTRFKRIEAISPPWFVAVDPSKATIYSIDFDLELQ